MLKLSDLSKAVKAIGVMVCMVGSLVPLQAQLRGVVLGCDQKPVGGAIVQALTSHVFAIADANGTFDISAAAGDSLRFSCVGFRPVSVAVPSNTTLRVVLSCNEVVEPVVIVERFFRRAKIGIDKGPVTYSIAVGAASEACIRIDNSKAVTARLLALHVRFHERVRGSILFQINFREIDSLTGQPGRVLNPDPFLIKAPFSRKFNYKLPEHVLIPPKGVYVDIVQFFQMGAIKGRLPAFAGHSFGSPTNFYLRNISAGPEAAFSKWEFGDPTVYVSADIQY